MIACKARLFLRRRRFDARRAPRCLYGWTYDDLSTWSTGNGAANQQQIARHIDANDFQIFDGAARVAHASGHALAREHATRRLTLADRSGRAVGNRHAV